MKKILAGERFSLTGGRLRTAAATLLALLLSAPVTSAPASATAAGELDPSFGTGGKVTTDFGASESASAAAVQPDGKLVVAGLSGAGGGASIFGDFCVVRYRPDGSLDAGFGVGGRVLVDFGNTADGASAVAIQPDGKIVVVGSAYSPGTSRTDIALVRFNADGTPDPNFGTNGKVTNVFPGGSSSAASSVALQADGRLVVAGVTASRPTPETYVSDFAAVRYNSDGTPDASFGAGGRVKLDFEPNDSVTGVALQQDGRIVLAGTAGNTAGGIGVAFTFALARLKADGSLDPTFDGDGKATLAFLGYDWCSGLALQSDGRIVVAGSSMSQRNRTEPDFALARLNADGSPDPTFGANGRVLADIGFGSETSLGVAVLPGGKIVTGGHVFPYGYYDSLPGFGAMRLNADGSPDNTFGVGGRASARFAPSLRAIVRGMIVQPDGKPVLVGDVERQDPSQAAGTDFGVARFYSAGAPDPTSFVRFSATDYGAAEGCAAGLVTLRREGDLSAPASVEYRTRDGSAGQTSDYTHSTGTLFFAAGEFSKTFAVPVNDDAYAEGGETIRLELVAASPNVNFRVPAVATLTVNDDDASDGVVNPSDDSRRFVCQHYHDFLGRQPDAAGLEFWTQGIEQCGSDSRCREEKRVDVSTAFFLSIEFQTTGYFVIRAHKAAFGDAKATPRYFDFLRDTQRVSQGVVVGTAGAAARLEENRQAFLAEFVARPEFRAAHDSQGASEYVDSLFLNAGASPAATERAAAVAAFGAGGDAGRAAALRSVAESDSVYRRLYNPAFVLSQYFGYLRRDPADAPDFGFTGYDFWLDKMNAFSSPGEDVRDEAVALARVRRAEMVRAFVTSIEYRRRFGP